MAFLWRKKKIYTYTLTHKKYSSNIIIFAIISIEIYLMFDFDTFR